MLSTITTAHDLTEVRVHHLRTTCRVCGGGDLARFLELGPTPLANSFLRLPEEFGAEAPYPLDAYFCENCTLVQLLDVIDPEILFRDYLYCSSFSETMLKHAQELAHRLIVERNLGPAKAILVPIFVCVDSTR